MVALFRSELFRLSRRLMPRVLVGILALAVAAIYLLFWSLLRSQPEGTTQADLDQFREFLAIRSVRETGLGVVQSVGTILAIILAVSLISSEYGWGTIRTLLPRAAGRSHLITAKLLLLVLFVIVISAIGYLVALAASAFVTALEGLDSDAGSGFVWATIASLARTVYVILPYVALSFVVALWTRSTAAGITTGLVLFLLEGLLGSLLGAVGGPLERVQDILLSRNVGAIMALNAADPDSLDTGDLPNVWQAAGVLAAYTTVFVALGYWRFGRKDVTSG